MLTAVATIRGISPYSASRMHGLKKEPNETHDDFEARMWREKAHCRKDGSVFIPAIAFKQALDTAANYLGQKIPGQGNSKYKKHFVSGVLVLDPMMLGIKKEDLEPIALPCHANGRRGSGSRVMRWFPIVEEWGGEVTFYVGDPVLTKEVFAEHLEAAGNFAGVGRFRPENGGTNGRFVVDKLKWA